MNTEDAIYTAQVTEDEDYVREWVSSDHPRAPRDMDGANRWAPGWYACDSNGEQGNAWAWNGPFDTKEEAIESVREMRMIEKIERI